MSTELQDVIVSAVCNTSKSELEFHCEHGDYHLRVPPVVPQVLVPNDFTGVTVDEALQLVYSCLFSITPISYDLTIESYGDN